MSEPARLARSPASSAAEAGVPLDDLAMIAALAIERWRQPRTDPDEDEARSGDRPVRLEGTCDGAAVLRGDLSPECTAALRAALEPLGRKRGAEDDRTEAQRYHDAPREACPLDCASRAGPGQSPVPVLRSGATPNGRHRPPSRGI